jgi:hypothetical protein
MLVDIASPVEVGSDTNALERLRCLAVPYPGYRKTSNNFLLYVEIIIEERQPAQEQRKYLLRWPERGLGVLEQLGSSGAVRIEDDGYVNAARIKRGRADACALTFRVQSGRIAILRSLSTTIRSISTIVLVPIDRTPLKTGQVHSGL